MAGDSRRRIVWNVAAAISVVFAFMVEETVAQVVIKERVEIVEETLEKVSTPVGIIEASFDGSLHVSYYLAHSHPNAIPSNDTLFVTANGSLLASEEYVQTRFDSPTTQLFTCNSQNGTRYTYQTLSLDPWIVGPVEEGDLITLSTNLMQAPVYDKQTDSTWTVIVQSADQCNDLYLLVSVERDTLDIHFTPPKDGNVYPEPGLIIDVKASVRGAGNNGEVVFEIENHDYPDTEYPDTLIYFLDGTDTTLTLDPVPVVNDTASAQLVVKQYWGAVDVTAKYVVDVPSKNLATTVILHEKSERWPEDNDMDGIPDEWERNNGYLSMINIQATCAEPSAECTGLDQRWDEEHVDPHRTDGDGIKKLAEYQGVLIGSSFMRLTPTEKEVFVDHHLSTHGAWAYQQVQGMNLGITMHPVEGLRYQVEDVVAGNSQLIWVRNLDPGEEFHYVLIEDVGTINAEGASVFSYQIPYTPGVQTHIGDGQIIVGSVYQMKDLKVYEPPCTFLPECAYYDWDLGIPPSPGATGYRSNVLGPPSDSHDYRRSTIGMVTISNMFTGNDLREDLHHIFHVRFEPETGYKSPVRYSAEFDGAGSDSDVLNPLLYIDRTEPVVPSESDSDGEITGMTAEEVGRYVALHEFGHSLGLHHHRDDRGVMQQIGLNRPDTFSDAEIEQIDLKGRMGSGHDD